MKDETTKPLAEGETQATDEGLASSSVSEQSSSVKAEGETQATDEGLANEQSSSVKAEGETQATGEGLASEQSSSVKVDRQVAILNWQKEQVGLRDLPKGFGHEGLNTGLVNEVIRWQRACMRQGTHKAKTRSDVSGGGKKPFRQKGTGNARQGSIRSPLNRGGGVTFGPKPRDYSYNLPRRQRKLAFWQVFSYLLDNEKVVVLESMQSTEGKTRELSKRLKVFGFKKALLVDRELDPLFKRAGANLPSFSCMPVTGLNVYDMLRFNQLMMSQSALSFLIKKYEEEMI